MTNTAETEVENEYERCDHAWAMHNDDPVFGEGCARCGIPRDAYDKLSALLSENERLKEAGQEALQQLDWLTASPEFGKLLRAALNGEPQ